MPVTEPGPVPPRDGSGAESAHVPTSPPRRALTARRLLVFVLLAYGGAWLVCLPLWLDGQGLRTPYATVLLLAMMVTPTVAAFLTHVLVPDGRRVVDVLGLRLGSIGRWWRYALLAWFGPVVVSVAAIALAAAVGVFTPDLAGLSGFAAQTAAAAGGQPLPIPIQLLAAITMVQVVFIAPVINAVPALGEELGWRGMLRDTLRYRPRWQVIVVTGVAWGLWHAPILLLGYNYPSVSPVLSCGAMVVFTTLVAALPGVPAGRGRQHLRACARPWGGQRGRRAGGRVRRGREHGGRDQHRPARLDRVAGDGGGDRRAGARWPDRSAVSDR